MEGKRKNVYIVIFIITTLVSACLAIYFGIERNNNETIITNLEADLKEAKSTANNETITNNTDKDIEKEKNTEKVEVSKIITFDNNKSVKNYNKEYTLSGVSNSGIVLNLLNSGDVTVSFTKDITLMDPNISEKFLANKFKITGFSGKVIDVNIGVMGPYMGDPVLFFLMEDGSVEHLKTSDIFKNDKLTSSGKLSGLSNIVKITSAYYQLGMEGYNTAIAINNEGYFCDLEDYIK